LKPILILLFIHSTVLAQTISNALPAEIRKSNKYLFYLHGGVVTVLGNNAINQSVPEWGPYEYLNILDSLRSRGFNVISENRKEGTHDSVYVNKVVAQIDSLLRAKVETKNILLIGASAGSNIVIHVSGKVKIKNLKFVIMGGCWPETYKNYLDVPMKGNFLSVIEPSDPHGTCYRIFENRNQIKSYQEIKLNTGLNHGFIYKGYKDWIDPIVQWSDQIH
jgi:hypothetical protein